MPESILDGLSEFGNSVNDTFLCGKCGSSLRFSKFRTEFIENLISRRINSEMETGFRVIPEKNRIIVCEEKWEYEISNKENEWSPYTSLVDSTSVESNLPSRENGLIQEFREVPWNCDNDWVVDKSLKECDDMCWLYSDIPLDGESEETDAIKKKIRKRRLTRQIVFSSESSQWIKQFAKHSSNYTRIPYPLCHQCETNFKRSLENELLNTHSELNDYMQFFENFVDSNNHLNLVTPENPTGVRNTKEIDLYDLSFEELKIEEERLLDEYESINLERRSIGKYRVMLKGLAREVNNLKTGTLTESAHLCLREKAALEEYKTLVVYFNHAEETLNRLQRYHVFNDAFHIWHDGQFGTINGLRLGRLPSRPVDWVEINAALGQTAMLLTTIKDRAGFQFKTNHRITARGSYSRISSHEGKEYSLYSDGSFMKRRGFNHAMVLLLEYVEQASNCAIQRDSTLQNPYPISKGKIGELSICLGDDEEWTRALKYMLTTLKWLLSWLAKNRL